MKKVFVFVLFYYLTGFFPGFMINPQLQPKQILIKRIDCTKDYGAEKYFELGDVHVASSSAGIYREAGSDPSSRFGYRFAIEHVNRPHLVVIRYPDDKSRSMAITDGSSYDLSVAVFTGSAHPIPVENTVVQPITGRMAELKQIFWPRWHDCSIVFGNNVKNEPAAVSSITIYELDDLPSFKMPEDINDGSRRELGVQYEDPCGATLELGATDREEWIEKMVTYMHYSGQNLLAYPIVWYHGPLYPSQHEPVNYFGALSSSSDRKFISYWTSHPDDWVAELLKRFGQEKLQFRAVLPVLRLGSLMEKMNINLDSIKAGKETFNNMTFKDQVQMGTYDWTLPYNLRNFKKLIEAGGKRDGSSTFPWVYGEKKQGEDGFRGPIFNPLHPTVQNALFGLTKEIVDRYGQYPAFKGIEFLFWTTSFLWFGSLKSGYDDYTVNLFQKETEIIVPVENTAPDRFSKRYTFLTETVKEQWIDWRCKKITHLFCHIRDIVTQARPELQVLISVMDNINDQREAGLDIAKLSKEKGIQIIQVNFPDMPVAKETPDASNIFSGIWMFNRWIESWGKHKLDSCDSQLCNVATIMGKSAEGVMYEKLKYPKDGFWWEQQWRITPVYQSGINFLQYYANAVAEYDALNITRGGLILDTGHAELIRPFACAFRALPAKKFETVNDSNDSVKVRTLICDGKRYVYMVNCTQKPLIVNVLLDKINGEITDLVTNRKVQALTQWPVVLGPFQLQSFSLASEVQITGFSSKFQ